MATLHTFVSPEDVKSARRVLLWARNHLMQEHKIPGTLKVIPGVAEELLGTKAFYIRAGYIECGRRSAFPHDHDQILFVKRLT